MDADYVCTLDERTLEKAKEELNEDPKERLSQIQTLRTWIEQQPHLRCPTDTTFLLRFLRQAKFSQLRAREVVENILKIKTEHPYWMDDVDLADPDFIKFLKSGYYLILPKRDPEGRKLVLARAGAFTPDPKIYKKEKMLRGMMAMMKVILMDEVTQVNGVITLNDFTGFTIKHQTFWGMDTMRKTTKMFKNSMPGRMKGFHYYNVGPVFESIMQVIKPMLPKKFNDRMHIHSTMESVYKTFPMECLPREYLPDDYTGPCAGTVNDIADAMIKELQDPRIRDRVLYESDKKWGNDTAQKPDDVPNESFRRLNVD